MHFVVISKKQRNLWSKRKGHCGREKDKAVVLWLTLKRSLERDKCEWEMCRFPHWDVIFKKSLWIYPLRAISRCLNCRFCPFPSSNEHNKKSTLLIIIHSPATCYNYRSALIISSAYYFRLSSSSLSSLPPLCDGFFLFLWKFIKHKRRDEMRYSRVLMMNLFFCFCMLRRGKCKQNWNEKRGKRREGTFDGDE